MLQLLILFFCTIGVQEDNQFDESTKTENSFLQRLIAFDQNDNGKIEKSELPKRLHKNFDRWDVNEDGQFDETEMQKISAADNRERATRQDSGNQEKPGRRSLAGSPSFDPGRAMRGRGPNHRPPGPPTAEEFVNQAMKFDEDANGQLNRDELRAAADSFLRNMPPPPPRQGGRRIGQGGPEFPENGRSFNKDSSRPPRRTRPEFDR